jgi:type II secretory pathway component GspD/PulD (secretin)
VEKKTIVRGSRRRTVALLGIFVFAGYLTGGLPRNHGGEEPVAGRGKNAFPKREGIETVEAVVGDKARPFPSPPLITVEAKWVELSGLDLEKLRGTEAEGNAGRSEIHARAELISMKPGVGWQTNALPGAKMLGPYQQEVSGPVLKAVVEHLQRREAVDMLSAPVTAYSGRAAEIAITHSQNIIVGISTNLNVPRRERITFRTEKMEFGPEIHVLATEVENGQIRLGFEGTIRQFEGYRHPEKGGKVVVLEDGKRKRTAVPLPEIRELSYSIQTEVASGETIVLYGLEVPATRKISEKVPVLGSIPGLGRLFRSEREESYTNQVILLLTAIKIDAAGNPLFP